MYIITRSPSNDQQLLYSETRLSDILEIRNDLSINNIHIKDVVRVFKGDNPAAQLEARQQKGGNLFCTSCKMDSFFSKSIYHVQSLPHLSLQDRIEKISCSYITTARIKHNNIKYFVNLPKDEVISELHERNVNFNCDQSALELRELLKKRTTWYSKATSTNVY